MHLRSHPVSPALPLSPSLLLCLFLLLVREPEIEIEIQYLSLCWCENLPRANCKTNFVKKYMSAKQILVGAPSKAAGQAEKEGEDKENDEQYHRNVIHRPDVDNI